jgi:hypothetical protein
MGQESLTAVIFKTDEKGTTPSSAFAVDCKGEM